MSNVELTKFYMGLLIPTTGKMPKTPASNIIPALNEYFGGQWTWELADEKFYLDNTMVSTTVTVYTPGRIYTGRSVSKISDYQINHLSAIANACESFMNGQEIKTNNNPQPINNNMQMTPDQIMAAINQPQQAQLQPQQQVADEPDELPFDTGNPGGMVYRPDNNNFMNPPVTPQQNNTSANADYDAPLEKYKGFSQHQIDRLNQFKKDYDILDDSMFGNFVNQWDKTLTSKSQITPINVESFLTWAENLGKMDC